MTSCTASDVDYSSGQIIQFPSTKTFIGISTLYDFQTTGTFNCEKSGVYLFAVFITNYGNFNADYVLYKNSQLLSQVVIVLGKHDYNYFSGWGTVVVQLNVGDTLLAKVNRNMRVAGSDSCFTVLRIN